MVILTRRLAQAERGLFFYWFSYVLLLRLSIIRRHNPFSQPFMIDTVFLTKFVKQVIAIYAKFCLRANIQDNSSPRG